MKYFAYGMNTNIAGMARRCPEATPIARAQLSGHDFAMRIHADIEQREGAVVWGALWEITKDCERALDNLEGYPHYYNKKTVLVKTDDGEIHEAMTYYMNKQDGYAPCGGGYEQTLVEGYASFDMPVGQIVNAQSKAMIETNKNEMF